MTAFASSLPRLWEPAVRPEPRAAARSERPAPPREDARSAHAEDCALLSCVVEGDAEALGRLYDRHAPTLLGLCQHVLRSKRDAEDLVHDVFLEAWEKAASYEPARGTVRAWLVLRARSRAIDRLRSLAAARRHGMAAAGEAETHAGADDPVGSADGARARATVAALSPERRRVIEASYFEGLSCSEIAARDGIPIGTVKSRMRAGLRDLRAAFEPVRGASR